MRKVEKILFKLDWVYIICLTIIFFMSCAGQVEEKQEKSDTEVSKIPPPPPKSKLAPRTAKIEASMIELNEVNNHFDCIIKVDKVLGYGSSTKPIGKGTEIHLQIIKADSGHVKILSDGTSAQKYEFIVEQEEMVGIPSNELRWRVIRINILNFE